MNGMDDNEEDENFLANDFDTIPANAWDELEQNAIQSTQHLGNENHRQQTIVKQISYQSTVAYQHATPRNSSGPSLQLPGDHRIPEQHYSPRPPYVQAVENGVYDDADIPTPVEEKEVNLAWNIRGALRHREPWDGERYGVVSRPTEPLVEAHKQPYSGHYAEHQPDGHNLDIDVADRMASNALKEPRWDQQHNPEREEALRTQIAELLRQRDDLTRELHLAKSTVMTQKGEVAIVRAKQAKGNQEFDRQLVALRKSIQEEEAKHKVDIDATNRLSEKIAIENQFLNHELKKEAERVKALQKSMKEKEARQAKVDIVEPVTTPKKVRQLPLRDGFNNEDIVLISPAKSGRRSKGGTPTNAGKRKRKAPDASPIPALTFHQPLTAQPKSFDLPKHESIKVAEKPLVIRKDRRVQKSLQFMQLILNHRLATDKGRILEVFSQYAFPSDTQKSFTSIVLEESASLSGETLPSGFMKIMISLWGQALKEKYYRPVATLTEIVRYIIAIESSVINSEIVQKIIPVLESSTDINGAVRFENSPVSHQNFGLFKETPRSELNSEVDGTATLEILYTIACSCVRKPKLMEDFWRTMDSNFILMMLNVAQPITDLSLTINLLSTSITATTFGTIMSDDTNQQKIEHYLVDRVVYLLWETPRVDEGVPNPTKDEIYQLRMEALSLLSELALTSPLPHGNPVRHGSLLLATHPSIIGRLVRFIYDTVDALYSPIEPSSSLHALLSSLINRSTFLLYRLLQLHGRDFNLHEKLTAVNGGVQKHRVVLTRLAFSEGLYLESGISDQTVAMAHEMLEEAVTPEEAEALVEAFPAFKGKGDEEEGDEGDEGDEGEE